MSIAWFPARLRNLATALAVLSYTAGCAIGYFVGTRRCRHARSSLTLSTSTYSYSTVQYSLRDSQSQSQKERTKELPDPRAYLCMSVSAGFQMLIPNFTFVNHERMEVIDPY